MRLLIISDMAHYQDAERTFGWGPTVQEIDRLAELFDEVRHVAFLHHGAIPQVMLPYQSSRVRLVPLRPSGGKTLAAKLGVIARIPEYLRVMLQELRGADVVHVRGPASTALLATIVLAFKREPAVRWVKYAGNWRPAGRESLSYVIQRWWLGSGLHRGVVTVNGEWPAQPAFVHSFSNPSFSDSELADARRLGSQKRMTRPLNLLFVGRIEPAKGALRLLEIVGKLVRAGLDVRVDIVGDGAGARELESSLDRLGLRERVAMHGWLARPAIAPLYARAHLFVLPTTSSEGWPKVLSEAMAFGVVPIASRLSSIPQVLERSRVGRSPEGMDVDGFADAIRRYYDAPELWQEESIRSMEAAETFTYENYLRAVSRLLASPPRP
jgi:glycosyltransferase involved in cell wall biosynthesis